MRSFLWDESFAITGGCGGRGDLDCIVQLGSDGAMNRG